MLLLGIYIQTALNSTEINWQNIFEPSKVKKFRGESGILSPCTQVLQESQRFVLRTGQTLLQPGWSTSSARHTAAAHPTGKPSWSSCWHKAANAHWFNSVTQILQYPGKKGEAKNIGGSLMDEPNRDFSQKSWSGKVAIGQYVLGNKILIFLRS